MPHSPGPRLAALVAIILVVGGGLGMQVAVSTATFVAQGKSALAAIWFVLLFFTILTNLFVLVAATAALIDPAGRNLLSRPSAQSAAALDIVVVGIVYSLALRGLVALEGWALVADRLLHDLSPVLFALYWLLFVPKGTLRWSSLPVWLIYPVGYLIYGLARGAAEGFYPYPFLDLAKNGAVAVALGSLMVLALFVAVGAAIVGLDRLIGARRTPSEADRDLATSATVR
jgi:hypothetical protein